MEHQEGAGLPRRCAREGGEPIQFGIAEFKSNSESRTTSYSNWRPDCIRPRFGRSMHARKAKEITFPMGPVSCPTKIRVVHNYQNSIDFRTVFWCCTTILARWAMYPVGVHKECVLGFVHDPRPFIFGSCCYFLWVLLRLICQEQFRRYSVCRTPTFVS
jgi:hypothetical protein